MIRRTMTSGGFRTMHFRILIATTIAAILSTVVLAGSIVATGLVPSLASTPSTGGYPYASAADCSAQHGQYSWCIHGSQFSSFGYGYRNCTDYVAWKIDQVLDVSLPKSLGNANKWGPRLKADGYSYDPSPRVGDIAAWNYGGGGFGHVAYVYAVNHGIASLDEYNVAGTGLFSSNRTTARSSAGPPSEFIHIGSSAGASTNSPTAVVASVLASSSNTSVAVCQFVLPAEQAGCRSIWSNRSGSNPDETTIQNFADRQVVEGDRALVVATGKTCGVSGDPNQCQSNSDSNTGFDSGSSFDALYSEATTSPATANPWIVPCQLVAGRWYVVEPLFDQSS